MKCKFLSGVTLFFLLMLTGLEKVMAQAQVSIIDSRHYSNVFSETSTIGYFYPKVQAIELLTIMFLALSCLSKILDFIE